MTYPVKWYDDTQTGAPVCNGQAGSLPALLDGCLISGFNLRTLTGLTRDGSVATATVQNGHGYREGTVLLIAGADQSEYNGEHRIHHVTATTFQFDVAGSPASPATGALTAKVAPVGGWEKAFSAGAIAAYRSTDPAASGLFLRVDDSGPGAGAAREAMVRGYEFLSDLDTGSGPVPTTGQLGAGIVWRKSSALDATPRRWVLVADQALFYLFIEQDTSSAYSGHFDGYCFGDVVSYRPGDAYPGLLTGRQSVNYSGYPIAANSFATLRTRGNNSNGFFMPRAYNQIGAAVAAAFCGHDALGGPLLGYAGLTYPSPVDNGLYYYPVHLLNADHLRGRMPGLYQPLHQRPLPHLATVGDLPDLPGRTLLAVLLAAGTATGESGAGQALIDITGPWR